MRGQTSRNMPLCRTFSITAVAHSVCGYVTGRGSECGPSRSFASNLRQGSYSGRAGVLAGFAGSVRVSLRLLFASIVQNRMISVARMQYLRVRIEQKPDLPPKRRQDSAAGHEPTASSI